jgi:transposase-like protein
MESNGRRKWTAAEKLRIVLEGMHGGMEVAELCRREGINPTQFYLWRQQLKASAAKIFDAKAGRPSARDVKQTAELQRMKNVIAEITAENLELKKTLSD